MLNNFAIRLENVGADMGDKSFNGSEIYSFSEHQDTPHPAYNEELQVLECTGNSRNTEFLVIIGT